MFHMRIVAIPGTYYLCTPHIQFVALFYTSARCCVDRDMLSSDEYNSVHESKVYNLISVTTKKVVWRCLWKLNLGHC